MAIDLAAPLEEIWSYQQPHVPVLPVVKEGMVFYGDSQRHTTAISEEGRLKLWQSAYRMTPEGWWGEFLIAYKHGHEEAGHYVSGPIQLLEPRTGRVCHEITVPGGCVGIASSERWVAGTGYEEQPTIWSLDPREPKVLWSNALEKGVHVAGPGPALIGDTVVLSLYEGELLAWHAATGTQRWASTVADLSWRRLSGQVEPGKVRGRPSVHGDRIFFNVYDHYVAALNLEDGSRAWSWGGPPFVVRDGHVVEDRYYALGWGGEYRILDAANGQELFAANLQDQVPRDLGIRRMAGPLLVTASHILVGSEQGDLIAFERDNGRFAWTYHPRTPASTEVDHFAFVVGANRIYYADYAFWIHCLGPKAKTAARRSRTPRPKSPPAHGDP